MTIPLFDIQLPGSPGSSPQNSRGATGGGGSSFFDLLLSQQDAGDQFLTVRKPAGKASPENLLERILGEGQDVGLAQNEKWQALLEGLLNHGGMPSETASGHGSSAALTSEDSASEAQAALERALRILLSQAPIESPAVRDRALAAFQATGQRPNLVQPRTGEAPLSGLPTLEESDSWIQKGGNLPEAIRVDQPAASLRRVLQDLNLIFFRGLGKGSSTGEQALASRREDGLLQSLKGENQEVSPRPVVYSQSPQGEGKQVVQSARLDAGVLPRCSLALEKGAGLTVEGGMEAEGEDRASGLRQGGKSETRSMPDASSNQTSANGPQARSAAPAAGNPSPRIHWQETKPQGVSPAGKDPGLNLESGRQSTEVISQGQDADIGGRGTHLTPTPETAKGTAEAARPFHIGILPRQAVGPGPLHTLNLKVHQTDLGAVRMRVQVHGEEVRALFVTEAMHHKAVLDRGLSTLRQGLLDQGFTVQDLEVQVSSQGGGQNGQYPFQNERVLEHRIPDAPGGDPRGEEPPPKGRGPSIRVDGQVVDVMI